MCCAGSLVENLAPDDELAAVDNLFGLKLHNAML